MYDKIWNSEVPEGQPQSHRLSISESLDLPATLTLQTPRAWEHPPDLWPTTAAPSLPLCPTAHHIREMYPNCCWEQSLAHADFQRALRNHAAVP